MLSTNNTICGVGPDNIPLTKHPLHF